jgi:hypothetical protein
MALVCGGRSDCPTKSGYYFDYRCKLSLLAQRFGRSDNFLPNELLYVDKESCRLEPIDNP